MYVRARELSIYSIISYERTTQTISEYMEMKNSYSRYTAQELWRTGGKCRLFLTCVCVCHVL